MDDISQRMFGTSRDNDIFGLPVNIVIPLELIGNGFAQIGVARNRRITMKSIIDRLFGGFADVLGCLEIRLPNTQTNYFMTLRSQFTGFFVIARVDDSSSALIRSANKLTVSSVADIIVFFDNLITN